MPQISHSLFVFVYVHMCVGGCMCVWAPGQVVARSQHGIISLIAHRLIVLGRLSRSTCTWLMQPVQQAWRRFSLYRPRAEGTRPHLAFTWVLGIEGRSLCLCSNYFTDWALPKALSVIFFAWHSACSCPAGKFPSPLYCSISISWENRQEVMGDAQIKWTQNKLH